MKLIAKYKLVMTKHLSDIQVSKTASQHTFLRLYKTS